MKLALLADIHSNFEALAACIEHARGRRVDRFVFLGDLVGYNADPQRVVDCVSRMERDEKAIVIQGNHDAAVAGQTLGHMNDAAALAVKWTQSRLSTAALAYLAALPLTARLGNALFVHASAAAPERWTYVVDGLRAAASMEAARATYVFSGHVHSPVLFYMGADRRPQPFEPVYGIPIPVGRHRAWLAITGSCGQPRDGDPAARYAEMDVSRSLLTFHRVPYDYEAAARKVRLAGLPELFARRLETGS